MAHALAALVCPREALPAETMAAAAAAAFADGAPESTFIASPIGGNSGSSYWINPSPAGVGVAWREGVEVDARDAGGDLGVV